MVHRKLGHGVVELENMVLDLGCWPQKKSLLDCGYLAGLVVMKLAQRRKAPLQNLRLSNAAQRDPRHCFDVHGGLHVLETKSDTAGPLQKVGINNVSYRQSNTANIKRVEQTITMIASYPDTRPSARIPT